MKFNQKNSEKQLLIKAVDKFTIKTNQKKDEQFTYKINKNEIEFLLYSNDATFDLCLFTWKISSLFFA